MKWNFINTGFNTGTFNMDIDAQLAATLNDGTGFPTLRVYGWTPYAISVGMNQRIEDFDTEKLNRVGIDIVRRPTGGRAILHADELTYSVAMRTSGSNLREVYRFINEGLLHGLHLLGIPAKLSQTTEIFRTAYQQTASIPCFTSSAKCEIQFQGRKLLGSAQRRYGAVVLQHGSLLLGPTHREIVEYLSADIQESKELILEQLDNHAIDLRSILGRTVSFEEAATCVRQGFTHACGIEFTEAEVPLALPVEV